MVAQRTSEALVGAKGIGHRPEIAADLLREAASIDFVEVVAETCFSEGRTRREVLALAELWPVVPHGVKLSLGSAEGIDLDRANKLGVLAREARAPFVTEHVALTSTAGREIGHLTPVPRSLEVVRALRRNVERARSRLPDVPLLLENIAVPFDLPGDALSEADFYCEVVEQTGCDLLLDVANLYANAINHGVDPVAVARAYPLERVGMIHLAGGFLEDDFYFDTHAHPVSDAVFDVLAAVLEQRPGVPIVLERDANFNEGVGPLIAELDRAHSLRPAADRHAVAARASRPTCSSARSSSASTTSSADPQEESAARLAQDQAELARLLTIVEAPTGPLAMAIGDVPLERARGVLQRKRVDDALPLLPRLGRRATEVRPLATQIVEDSPRGLRMQAVLDAFAIAEGAKARPDLADDAARDRLTLAARFDCPSTAHRAGGRAPSARKGPFVARERLASGAVVWAIKGFGALARVHLRETIAVPPSARDQRR